MSKTQIKDVFLTGSDTVSATQFLKISESKEKQLWCSVEGASINTEDQTISKRLRT